MPWAHSAALKQQIENKLASRIPSALSPAVQQEPRLLPIGIPAVEALLGGGLPLGGISEFTGPATSGRTSLALALLGEATAEAACAYIDVSSSLDPKSAAAAGVRLENLLWVRFDVPPAAAIGPQKTVVTVQPLESPRPGWGWTHPRTETKGIAPALETMLVEKAQARLQKAAGTPGFPNRKLELKAMPPACDPDSKLGLAAVSDDQVAYDRFNARRTDEADPRRRQDVAAAAQARELARRARPTLPSCAASENPWARLDKAIRATDQVLQSGGFRVVVLDLASVPAEQAYRNPGGYLVPLSPCGAAGRRGPAALDRAAVCAIERRLRARMRAGTFCRPAGHLVADG